MGHRAASGGTTVREVEATSDKNSPAGPMGMAPDSEYTKATHFIVAIMEIDSDCQRKAQQAVPVRCQDVGD